MAKEFNKYKLPENWIWVDLGDILETTSGGTPRRNRTDYYNGSIAWVKSGELNYNIITDTEERITDVALKNSSAKLFPKGTLLIALYGATVGRLAFLGIDASTNQAVCGIFRNSNIDIKYIYYYLMSQYSFLNSLSAGGAQPNISQTIIKKLNVPLPPLNEQNRIVLKLDELLSELEKGKEQLQNSLEQLKVYRQSVLKNAFEGKLTDASDIRLGTLEEVIDNVEYGSATKSKKAGKVPVLRMGNIQNGKFEWDDLVYTSDDNEIEKYLLKKGDVLFNRTNSPELVGKTAIYKGEMPAVFAGYLIRINFSKDRLDPNYLNYFLNSQIAKNHGNVVKSFGVNQANINGTKLKQYPFPICNLDLQKEIVLEIDTRLSVCDKMEADVNGAIQQAEALKLSILQTAFEGKLVGQNAADEPAIVLLERIKRERDEYLKSEKEQRKSKLPTKMSKTRNPETDPKLIESIMKDFGKKSFTFDQLRSKVNLPYDELKEELFALLDKGKALRAEFNTKEEQMEFKYINK
jgi:type I restriction enzyme, S subunit